MNTYEPMTVPRRVPRWVRRAYDRRPGYYRRGYHRANREALYAPACGCGGLLLGVEWEAEPDPDYPDALLPNDLLRELGSAWPWWPHVATAERDGSLEDGGVELITRPMCWQHFRSLPWRIACDVLSRAGWRAHDGGACGLHVTLDLATLGVWGLWRLSLFIHQHLNWWGRACRRGPGGYCEVVSPWYRSDWAERVRELLEILEGQRAAALEHGELTLIRWRWWPSGVSHYDLVSPRSGATEGYAWPNRPPRPSAVDWRIGLQQYIYRPAVEVRLPRSTLRYGSLIGTVGLVHAAATWCAQSSLAVASNGHAIDAFTTWLDSRPEYEMVCRYLEYRGLL